MKQMPAEVQMALGRIFSMMERPFENGDIEQYEACRALILDAAEPVQPAYQPNYVRDRLKGAAGQ